MHDDSLSVQSPKWNLRNRAWLIFALLTACYSMVSFYRTSASTLAMDIMSDFAVGGGLLSVMSAAYFYPYGLMQIPAGIFADRWGARKTISLFLLLGAGGALLFGLATTVFAATCGRVLMGIGMGMVFVPALRVILYWFPLSRHALCTGLLLSLGTCGMLLATSPLMALTQRIGWRGSMFAAAFVTVLLAFLTWIWVCDTPASQKTTQQPTTIRQLPLQQVMARIARSRTYWSVSIWFFCMFGSFYAMTGLWAGPYFVQGYGMDKGTAGALMFCMALGAVVGPTLVGMFTAVVRLPKSCYLLIASGMTILLAQPLLLATPAIPVVILPVWCLAFGIFCGGFGGIALSKIQEDFPPEIVGTATGMINVYSFIGTAILQMGSGCIMEWQTSGQGAYNLTQYSNMFILFMVMFALSFVANLSGWLSKRRFLTA